MQMYYKDDNAIVEVYNFFEGGGALIFSPSLAGKQNGNGWIKVKVNKLIPIEYYNACEDKSGFMSKTKKNKIKSRLTLTHATWTCTDGKEYNNCEEAIAHENTLMEEEKHAEQE